MPKFKYTTNKGEFVIDSNRQLTSSELEQTISKTSIPKKQTLWEKTGSEITPQMEQESPYLSAIGKTAQDVTTIPAHFINQLLLNAPRSVLNKMNISYPETKNPVANVVAKTAGFIGGVKNPIVNKLMIPKQGTGLLSNIVKPIVGGATTGALYSPTENFTDIKQRGVQAGIGATMGAIPGAIATVRGGTRKLLGALSGVPKEIITEAEKLGLRNVLNKKNYDITKPAQLQKMVERNIENKIVEVGGQFNKVKEELQNQPFDFKQIKDALLQKQKDIKINPFEGKIRTLDLTVKKAIEKANPKTVGEVLDLRRQLDEVLFTAKGEKVKSKFADEVRKSFNDILHRNETLKQADEAWTSLERTLKEKSTKSILGDTGEKFLGRYQDLTLKQKEKLGLLESVISGTPFTKEAQKYSLGQKFLSKPSPTTGLFNIMYKTAKPVFRSYLRKEPIARNLFKNTNPVLPALNTKEE